MLPERGTASGNRRPHLACFTIGVSRFGREESNRGQDGEQKNGCCRHGTILSVILRVKHFNAPDQLSEV
jgi:hypothetical protein